MKITSLVNGRYLNKKNNQQNVASNPSFGAYKLIGKFKDPNYTWIDNFVYELSNKIKVVIIPKKGPDAVSVKTVIKTGALNETENLRGESHFTEHLLFDGSKDLNPGQFDKIAESKGASTNAHTGTQRTAYFFTVTGAKDAELAELIKAHSNMVKYPTLPNGPFKKEKEVVIQEIYQYKNDPAGKLFDGLLKDLFGIKSDAESMTLGEEENIRRITRKDIFDYHKRTYSPNNMEVYVAGAVSPQKIIKEIDKTFDTADFRPIGTANVFEEINPLKAIKMSFWADSKVQSSTIYMGFAGPENASEKESVATQALMEIIANGKHARYNKKLSNLDTEGGAFLEPVTNKHSHPKVMLFAVPAQPGHEQKILDYFRETVRELKTTPITEQELKIAKNRLLDDFSSRAETSDGITDLLEDFSVTSGIEGYKNQVNYIKDLSLADVNKVADKYLDPNKAAISILQPEKAQNTSITFTGKTIIQPKSLKKYILPNNIKLVINDTVHKIRTAVSLKIESSVSAKPGTSEILAKLLENSTAKHSGEEFALLKAEEGVNDVRIVGGKDFQTEYGRPMSPITVNGLMAKSESPKEFLPSAIKVIKEMIFEPKIDEVNFQKAKNEISLSLNNQLLFAEERAYETMYAGHSKGIGVTPRLMRQELDKVTLEDVQKYYADLMQNANATAAISGPISKMDGLRDQILSELGGINHVFAKSKIDVPTKFVSPKTNQVAVQPEGGRTQSHIVQLFHFEPKELKDMASMSVLDAILGSGGMNARLFLDLREKQKLAYHTSSKFTNMLNFAQEKLVIKTGVSDGEGNLNDNIEKSLLGFEKHIKKLANTLPTEAELARVKKVLLNAYIELAAEVTEQNDLLLKGMGSRQGAELYNKMLAEVERVTPQDVQNAAKKYLKSPSVTSILTSEEAAEKAEAFLKTRGEYKFYPAE